MTEALKLFPLETCEATPNAISLPASESGPMRCVLPDGQMIDLSGLQAVLASLSAKREEEAASTMRGISGQLSLFSSNSDSLAWSLASKYQAKTGFRGSILYAMTWNERRTPSGRLIPRLAASARGTFVTDCIGLAGWPTPQARDSRSGCAETRAGNPDRSNNLNDFVLLSGWPTPTKRDWKSGEASEETFEKNCRPLSEQAMKATGYFVGPYGLEIRTHCGQLNPALPRWLMGLPKEWDLYGAMAMQSMRTRRRRGSKQ